ncbi:MAG: T9SS type A sorting domain-containing protein [Prolixibacteraceae bacterium]|nr:T9SS type A sorting domain-containing protein [Prolixibacteraceae bacterium]
MQVKKIILIIIFSLLGFSTGFAQSVETKLIQIDTKETFQEITGFGASLAFYENWLTAHPNRNEIYNIIFKELSLDILRVRNAYGYDNGMVGRVKQFATAANIQLGHPIDILVTSWGPPASLKSNNERVNGGTIKYSVEENKVVFDYGAFANWWNESLDNYNANGIYPRYIGIQNEPDFSASWESCLLKPSETINSTDTIAGYNKALDAVYDVVSQRDSVPYFLGPECVGIGYGTLQNYINALDLSKLYGIGHHLYHGAESGTVEGDPFTSSYYRTVGNFHPEVPHFQTEYSRADWFSVAAMMYQTLVEESATAFLYWDLVWVNGGGLVSIDNPWDRNSWGNTKGYRRTKFFYVFKHYSAFIHPDWKRIGTTSINNNLKSAAFISNSSDSASFVVINRSETDTFKIQLDIPDYKIEEAVSYSTSENENFKSTNYLADTLLVVPPKSVNTVDLRLSKINTAAEIIHKQEDFLNVSNFPNPFSESTTIRFNLKKSSEISLSVFNIGGQQVVFDRLGDLPSGNHNITFNRNRLEPGLYFFKLENSVGEFGLGKLMVQNKN